MYQINELLSFKKKGSSIVVYLNFNFYFLKANPAKWIKLLLNNKQDQIGTIPVDFLNYLIKEKIIKLEDNKRI